MAQTIKSQNMPAKFAALLFASMNEQFVELVKRPDGKVELRTQLKPTDKRLVYPYGWYFAKGNFRNKHQSDSGLYEEVRMKCWDGGNHDVELPSDMEEVTYIW